MTVSGAQNASGTTMAARTRGGSPPARCRQCPCSIWQNGTPAGAVDSTDTDAVTLGVQFQASSSGSITGVRFYKEADNTGAHTGTLWSRPGTLLASGTFTQRDRERVAGAGLLHPGGGDRGDDVRGVVFHQHRALRGTPRSGLASAVTNGPLTALAGGGVYAYGSSSTFPTSTYNSDQLLGRRGVLAVGGCDAAVGD